MKKTIYYLSLVALGFGCVFLFAFVRVTTIQPFAELTQSSAFTNTLLSIILCGGVIYLFKVLKKKIRKLFKFDDETTAERENE